MIVQCFYLLVFAVNLLVFINYVCRKEYQNGLNFFICIALLIRSYGQFMVSVSEGIDMALFAYQMFYFGSAFLPAMLFMAAARLCKTDIPMALEFILLAFSTVIMSFALSIGNSSVYYSNVWLQNNVTAHGTFNSIGKEYGPAHSLYTAMLAAYAVGFVILAVVTYRKKNRISKRIITEVSSIALGIIVLYGIGRLIKTPVSLTSVGYLIATVFSVRIISLAELHNLTDCIIESMDEDDEEGYVVFDRHENFINANNKAKEIYPEINDLAVGRPVPDIDNNFSKHILKRVREYIFDLYNPENETVVKEGDRKFEIKLNDIVLRKGSVSEGIFVEIEDVTFRENIAEVEAKYSRDLEADVEKKEAEIRDMQNRLVLGLATLVESRDSSTGEHIGRTLKGVEIFTDQLKESRDLNLPEEYLYGITLAMPMHDLGKIAIDDDILRAKEKTPEQEKALIRLHTEEGAKIVRKVLAGLSANPKGAQFIEIAASIANYHHERWDGSGLPYGLRGKEIPTEARIVSFIDELDTLIDDGDETGKKTFDEAFDMVVNRIGTGFDAEYGPAFVKCRQKLKKIYEDL